MKPVLYWTLIQDWGNYKALGVTSEGPRGRINGRFEDNYATHTTSRNITGRFDTLGEALDRVDRVKEINKKYEALRKPYMDKWSKLNDEERIAIKEAVK